MQTIENTKFSLPSSLGSFLSISMTAEIYPGTSKLMSKYRVATMKLKCFSTKHEIFSIWTKSHAWRVLYIGYQRWIQPFKNRLKKPQSFPETHLLLWKCWIMQDILEENHIWRKHNFRIFKDKLFRCSFSVPSVLMLTCSW